MADRNNHKSACNGVKKAQDHCDREEKALRANPGDVMMPADVFTNGKGSFWGILGTRDYMRARSSLVEAIMKFKTFDGINAALDHLLDMLRLSRGDNMGVRDRVGAMMLRSGRDQECYDFVKWWQTTGQRGDYSWGDMSLPYLDIVGADAFESIDYLPSSQWLDLPQYSTIALLKVKLLLDLTTLQNSSPLRAKVPSEIVGNVQRYTPRSPLISGNVAIMNRADHTSDIKKLTAQVEVLYKAIDKANKYFWNIMINSEKHMNAHPEAYTHGSLQHAQFAMIYTLNAWDETPRALEFIYNVMAKDRGWPSSSSISDEPMYVPTEK